ncbi:hypothetical protein CBR_g57071 [Chara braunii]|uniref:Reverse transcriptase domain-containing protein n=1 Tax=Chara braunii TaxID=69332 RepID=A0A388K803_CHABU|nr:hypothetical protein CBR_g57071 [Chara braunii]|eukprot:GBG66192.1 hypothetical protein CBR_g57071 [Chara braunii]
MSSLWSPLQGSGSSRSIHHSHVAKGVSAAGGAFPPPAAAAAASAVPRGGEMAAPRSLPRGSPLYQPSRFSSMQLGAAAAAVAVAAKLMMMYEETQEPERVKKKARELMEESKKTPPMTRDRWKQMQELRPRTPFESRIGRERAKIRSGSKVTFDDVYNWALDVFADALQRRDTSIKLHEDVYKRKEQAMLPSSVKMPVAWHSNRPMDQYKGGCCMVDQSRRSQAGAAKQGIHNIVQELKQIRLQEAETKFWIVALRVPLDAYYYLRSAVTNMFGAVLQMQPPEFDPSWPKLMSVKLDLDPAARYLVDDDLVIESPKGERWKVEIATPYTDWCCRSIEVLEIVQSENLDIAVPLVDLEKAYDKVGFGEGFCRWVVVMYTAATSAVMINGHLSAPFKLSRSLRQGCPLAPLLFVLQMEVLLNRIRRHPEIRGLQSASGAELRVKALADDLFAVCENTEGALKAMKEAMAEYSTLSEATVNWNKSTYLLPKAYRLRGEWGMKRVEEGEEERFLGVLISLQVDSTAQGLLLQHRIAAKLQLWGTAWHLSIIGRTLVFNATLFSTLWFVSAVRELAESVLIVIRRMVARFLWKPRANQNEGFLVKIAWKILTFLREKGGLGLMDPTRRNQAQLRAWICRVASANSKEHWVELAERILMQEWGLISPEDTWTCFFMESFRKKRLKSKFWNAIRKAWNKSPPDAQNPPRTKEEVLLQNLFENPLIQDHIGNAFKADGSTGSFGLAWMRKGIVRIKDLWSTLLGGWRSKDEVKATWLLSRGMGVELICNRCNWPFESTRHLWWECPTSKRIWGWWKQQWEEMGGEGAEWNEEWVILGFLPANLASEKGKEGWGYIAHVVRGIICEIISVDRNKMIFEKKTLSDTEIKRRIKMGVKQAINVDWRRKVKSGVGNGAQRTWFRRTRARSDQLVTVNSSGELVFAEWILNGKTVPNS